MLCYDKIIEAEDLTYEEACKLLPKNWEELFLHTSLIEECLTSEPNKFDVKVMQSSENKHDCRLWIRKQSKYPMSSTYYTFVSYESQSRCSIYSCYHREHIYEDETMHAVLLNVYYYDNVLEMPRNMLENSITHDAIEY